MSKERLNIRNTIQSQFYSSRTLTIDECNLLLPEEGYKVHNYTEFDSVKNVMIQNLGCKTEKESMFFSKIITSKCDIEKMYYKNLLKLLRSEKTKHKKALEYIRKHTQNAVFVECLILFCMSFDLSDKVLRNVYKIVSDSVFLLEKEVVYLSARCLYCKLLSDLAMQCLLSVYKKGIEHLFAFIDDEIACKDRLAKTLLGRIVGYSMVRFGYTRIYDHFAVVQSNSIYKTEVFLVAHHTLFRLIDNPYEDFLGILMKYIDCVMDLRSRNPLRVVCSLTSTLAIKGMLKYDDCIKMYSQLYDKYSIQSIANKEQITKSVVVALANLSRNSRALSVQLFLLLKKLQFDMYNIKALNIVLHNLDKQDTIAYLMQNVSTVMSHDCLLQHFKTVTQIFTNILPSEEIENELVQRMVEPNACDLVLEIFAQCDNLEFRDTDLIKNNYFLLLRNNNRVALQKFELLSRHFVDDAVFSCSVYEIGKNKLDVGDKEQIVYGLRLVEKVVNHLDRSVLKKLCSTIFARLDQNDCDIFRRQAMLIGKIVEACRVGQFTNMIIELLPLLNDKNKCIKWETVNLISILITHDVNRAHNIIKTDILRICYTTCDILTSYKAKHKHNVTRLLAYMTTCIQPQEVVNVLMKFILDAEIKSKTQIYCALAETGYKIGMHNILPILVTDYKFVEEKIQLTIIRCLSSMKLNASHVNFILPVIEDCVLKQNTSYRLEGLKCFNSILEHTRNKYTDVRVMVHLLNLVWYNILEKNADIKNEFDNFVCKFTQFIGASFLHKYVAVGLHHPSKTVRGRYKEINELINKYGQETFS